MPCSLRFRRSYIAPNLGRRRRLSILLSYVFTVALFAGLVGGHAQHAQAAPSSAPAIPLKLFAYAIANSSAGYDIMLSDGVKKDRRVARVKVDSVYFADVSARLSTDAAQVALRVTGDRLGGSNLYNVNVASGKFVQISGSKTASEGIGAYVWSPAGSTLAFVRIGSTTDPAAVDDAYGTIHIYSVGFQAVKLKASNGNDRLLGFSPDGLGVYVARRETREATALEHLAYLPLSGESATVMLKSQPALRYSRYALVSTPGTGPLVAFVAEGDFAQAARNSNVHEVAPAITTTVSVEARAPGSNKLARPASLGLVVSDLLGIRQVLLRRDAEHYTHLSWAPDGSALLAGSARGSWRIGFDGSRLALGTSVAALSQSTAAQTGTQVVMSDNPTTRLVTLDYRSGKVAATRYVGVSPKPAAAAISLKVPYIHQVNDTAEYADGNWACGPTSVAMALAYYGKLEPWYVTQNERLAAPGGGPATPVPTQPPSGVDFAPYVTSEYSYNGRTYSATARDPKGNAVAGLYGTICPTGLASWSLMSQVLSWHGLSSQRVAATWDGVVGALKRGHPVLLGNQLTPEGHILLVIGYTNDGNLIVNDPYGNKLAPGYGSNDGKGILYPWKRVTPRNALEVIGVYPPPTATPLPATPTPVPPTATRTPTPAPTATPTATHRFPAIPGLGGLAPTSTPHP